MSVISNARSVVVPCAYKRIGRLPVQFAPKTGGAPSMLRMPWSVHWRRHRAVLDVIGENVATGGPLSDSNCRLAEVLSSSSKSEAFSVDSRSGGLCNSVPRAERWARMLTFCRFRRRRQEEALRAIPASSVERPAFRSPADVQSPSYCHTRHGSVRRSQHLRESGW